MSNMVKVYDVKWKSMTSGNIYAITANNNVICRNDYKVGGFGWLAVSLKPEDIKEMVKAGVLCRM